MSLLSISESTTNLAIKSLSLFENAESGRKSNLAAILFFLQIEHCFFTSRNIIRFKRKVKTLSSPPFPASEVDKIEKGKILRSLCSLRLNSLFLV